MYVKKKELKSKMCEIQFIKRLDGKNINSQNLKFFIKSMSLGDLYNHDAFGVFNGLYKFRKEGRFDYKPLDEKKLLSDNFIVGHNRFTTKSHLRRRCSEEEGETQVPLGMDISGNPFFSINASSEQWTFNYLANFLKSKKTKNFGIMNPKINESVKEKKDKRNFEIPEDLNINDSKQSHPFTLGDFVLVHNGIVYNYPYLREKYNLKSPIYTDSYIILFLIDKYFKASKKIERRERIVNAIQKTMKEVIGYSSVFLFDKVTKDLFYFKDGGASFFFKIVDNKLLLGTTSKQVFKNMFYKKNILGPFKNMKRRKIVNQNLFKPKEREIYLIPPNSQEGFIKAISSFNHNLKKKRKIELKGGKAK